MILLVDYYVNLEENNIEQLLTVFFPMIVVIDFFLKTNIK